VGKTGLASGLLLKAIQNGYRGRFVRAQDLFDDMYASLADRSTRRLLNALIRIDVLPRSCPIEASQGANVTSGTVASRRTRRFQYSKRANVRPCRRANAPRVSVLCSHCRTNAAILR
jgi:hypothetical protein